MAIEKQGTSGAAFLARAVALGTVCVALCAGARAQSATERASLSSAASEGHGDSDLVALSGNGRFVAFRSASSDLVPGDTNGVTDVFVRDRWTGTIERVSVSSAGVQGDADSTDPGISVDGRWVVFGSRADSLTTGVPATGSKDIFLHDRQAHTTAIVTRAASGGGAANGDSHRPRISSDGRHVSFEGSATNLVAGTSTSGYQVFRCDLLAGTTALVSAATTGASGNSFSWNGGISGDGRYVAFVSQSSDLVAGDTNGYTDCFVRDLATGTTSRADVSSTGVQANGSCFVHCALSHDGRWVAFSSDASNLAPGEFAAGYDIFLRDRQTAQTYRISTSSSNQPANGNSYEPALSDDGRFVAFQSFSTNLDPLDTDTQSDIFLRDRQLGTTVLVSRGASLGGDGESLAPQISTDGALVAFQSTSTNLVPQDTNARIDVFVRDVGRVNYTAFCAGLATTCPCGNVGLGGAGCESSAGTGGALLRAFGGASVAADQVTLLATGLPAGTSSLFHQGTARDNGGAGTQFGDGLRCTGGTLMRLAHVGVVSGVAAIGYGGTQGIPGSSTTPIHVQGLVPASGGTRTYQVWYRNSATFCTSAPFNLSNGVEIVWTP